MSDFLYCILSYIAYALILTILPAILWRMHPEKKERSLALQGLLLAWVSLIFNIIYTGVLGWNRMPASSLEWKLDILTGFLLAIGILVFQYYNSAPKEDVNFTTKM